jgi:PIN domain nuclease of toxin-antitoxin system
VIVLDTHVWIWWMDDNPRLRREVRDQLDAEQDVRISAISLLEIATATSLNRLVLQPSVDLWLEAAQTVESVRIEPLNAAVCLESVRLPGEFHRDPADRLVVALARQPNAPLCTADGRIRAYPHVACIAAEA